MNLRDTLQSMDLTETGLWGVIGLSGGYCAVTMVFVPLLAFLAGSYLTVTAQYGIAIGLTVIALGFVYWIVHRWTANADASPTVS